MSRDAARREARRRFGGVDQARERFRDASGFPSLDELAADVRYSLRMIRRQPGFALIVVLLVAIGVGANTAIFSLVNAILLRPLAYPAADRLVVVRTVIPAMARTYPSVPAAAGEFLLWQSRVTAFDSIAAVKAETQTLTGAGDASRVEVVRVTSALLPMLGAQPILGRVFRTDEDREGHEAVAMLTYQSWQQRFGGDRSILGRSITLDGKPCTVVGVLPVDFRYPRQDQLGALVGLPDRLDILRPAAFVADERENLAGDFDWAVIGRLRPGATLAQADAQANAVTREIARQYGDKLELVAQVIPLHEQIVQQSRRGILLLGWSVAAVLVVLVVNLANLLLSRVSSRAHEASVRAALGAGRIRVARQLVIENLLLAGAGGVAGLGLASAAVRVLAANAPDSLARLDEVRLDGVVLLFGIGVSLAAGLLFSALPAWRLAGASPQATLRASARSRLDGEVGAAHAESARDGGGRPEHGAAGRLGAARRQLRAASHRRHRSHVGTRRLRQRLRVADALPRGRRPRRASTIACCRRCGRFRASRARRSCRSRRSMARRTSGRSASITTRGHSISGQWSISASSIPATFHRWASR